MRGHNTMSLLLIIFSDFVTLKRMHRVFSISFNPGRPLRMLRSGPLKHRLIAFTHTHKHRLSWIAASASSPPDPQTPNLPPKTFPLPFQSGATTSLLHQEKGGAISEVRTIGGHTRAHAWIYGTCSRSDPPQQKGPQLLALRDLEQRVDPRSEPQQQRATAGHGCQALSPCWGESGAAVTSPDGEEQNGVSLPLAGPAEVMGRGRGWAHRHRRGKQSRQQECSWKQARTQTCNAGWKIMVLIECGGEMMEGSVNPRLFAAWFCWKHNPGSSWSSSANLGPPLRWHACACETCGFTSAKHHNAISQHSSVLLDLATPANKRLFLKRLIISFCAPSTAHPR